VERAAKTPVTKERLLEQLTKTGGTPFAITCADCVTEDDIYINVKEINDLRRRAVAGLERRITGSYKRPVSLPAEEHLAKVVEVFAEPSYRQTVLVTTLAQAAAALESKPYRLYLECTPDSLAGLDRIIENNNGAKIFAALPPCNLSEDKLLARMEESGISGYLVRTYGQLQKLKDMNSQRETALDYSFNVTNAYSFAELAKSASSVCVSPELGDTLDIAGAAAEFVVYGRLTLMTTSLCPAGIAAGKEISCRLRGKPGEYTLTGRAAFPVFRDCESCTARILSPINDIPLPENLNAAPSVEIYKRFDFTTESPDECRERLCLSCLS
jgi:putative protease